MKGNFRQLPIDKKFYIAAPRRVESGLDMYQRERLAIDETLDKIPHSLKDILVVFVSHGVEMKNFYQGLIQIQGFQTQSALLEDVSEHSVENCEIYFFKRNGKEIEPLRRHKADFTSISAKAVVNCFSSRLGVIQMHKSIAN